MIIDDLARELLTERRIARFQRCVAERLDCLTVAFDRVLDPRNLSACIRTCDAFGVQDVYSLSEQRLGLTNPITMSTHKWVDVHHVATNEELLAVLSRRDYCICGTVVPGQGGIPFHELPLPARLALIVGSERVGLDDALRQHCDVLVSIPTWGFVDSLNLSNATAVLLQHFSSAYRAQGLGVPLPPARQEALVRAWCEREVRRKLRGGRPPVGCQDRDAGDAFP